MRSRELTEASAVACLPFDGEQSFGFALPLFTHPGLPSIYFVQEVDECSNVISAFVKLNDDVRCAVPLEMQSTSRIGGEPVYSFIEKDGSVHAGPLSRIKPLLVSSVERHSQYPAIVLQILELVGTTEEKRKARARMRSTILKTSGPISASAFYEGSVLRSLLWERLVSCATDADSARRILAARSKIDLHVKEGGNVELNLFALDPADYVNVDINQIIRELEAEFKSAIADDPYSESQMQFDIQQHRGRQERAKETQKKISGTTRQEERIAIILETILQDREVGRQLLQIYTHDKAKYTDIAISHLKYVLENDASSSTFTSDTALVHLVLEQFLGGMPNSRALIFLYLATHLAKFPEVKRSLRDRLKGLYSHALNQRRQEIERLLE